METIHPHIDAAYRRVNALQSQRCARRGMAEFIALLPLPAIVVDWQLGPLFHNTARQEAAARWTGADPCLKSPASEFAVPADLLGAIAEMKDARATALHAASGPMR